MPAMSRPDPRLSQPLWLLALIAASLIAVLPPARGCHPLIGWLPLWLLAGPAASLLALYRRSLAATLFAVLNPRSAPRSAVEYPRPSSDSTGGRWSPASPRARVRWRAALTNRFPADRCRPGCPRQEGELT